MLRRRNLMGKTLGSDIDNNVWKPGVYEWHEEV